MKSYKIIGAGLTGLTLARLFADKGISTEIIESRNKLGGNCSCHWVDEIEVHEYGPHIFHTSDEVMWNFVNRFTKFNQFKLNIIAKTDKGTFFLPFNLSLFNQFFDRDFSPAELEKFIKKDYIENPGNLEEKAISLVGWEIYETFIKGYTKKQWGTDPKNLPASIITRLPVRASFNVDYYDDMYSGIPINGYQTLFENMIDENKITIMFNRTFSLKDVRESDTVFYTGQIDKLFGYRFGKLPYRSLRFEFNTYSTDNYQGATIVNYPDESVPWTRQYEFRWFHPEIKLSKKQTIVCREYPMQEGEPFYPIESTENNALYEKYVEYAKEKYPNIVFCGRLGKYKYFDMDDAINNAMEIFAKYG